MARVGLIVFLLLVTLVKAQEVFEGLRQFFGREGYAVKVDGNRVIVDLGRDKVRVGEEFDVYREGREVVHPVTKQVLGREREKTGRIRIEQVQEGFSYATLLEGSVREGDRIRLSVSRVCFEGSEDGLYRLRSVLEEVSKDKECAYTVRELRDGLGVEFRGVPVAFFQQRQVATRSERVNLEELNVLSRAKLIRSLNSLPLSADLCDLTGTGKEFLVLLFQGRVEVHELIKAELIRRFEYTLPAGVSVGLQCGKIGEGNQDLVIVNMVTGDNPSSIILKAVGDGFIPVVRNVPYIMGILNKERARETFIGQRFSLRDKFGQAVKLSLQGERLREVSPFPSPRGFRIDSAFSFGEYLLFTDTSGRLRAFKGDGEIFSTEEGFGGSYTLVEIPLEQGKINFLFNPKGVQGKLLDYSLAIVVKNHMGVAQRFFDIVKYSRGELFLVAEKRKDVMFIKQIRGGNFEEAVQSLLMTKDGRLLVITGKTGTMGIQNRGEVYEVELSLL
ncbi:MAG: hypothetical protein NZ526_03145 [Aquificaceae bacterium]|nr:hypothetical protein [Aquificaceae bacterium]